MSWTINLQGTSENLINGLDMECKNITDPQSLAEYKEALPVLKALVLVSLNDTIPGRGLRLVANGGGKGITQRTCSVSLAEWDTLI